MHLETTPLADAPHRYQLVSQEDAPDAAAAKLVAKEWEAQLLQAWDWPLNKDGQPYPYNRYRRVRLPRGHKWPRPVRKELYLKALCMHVACLTVYGVVAAAADGAAGGGAAPSPLAWQQRVALQQLISEFERKERDRSPGVTEPVQALMRDIAALGVRLPLTVPDRVTSNAGGTYELVATALVLAYPRQVTWPMFDVALFQGAGGAKKADVPGV